VKFTGLNDNRSIIDDHDAQQSSLLSFVYFVNY